MCGGYNLNQTNIFNYNAMVFAQLKNKLNNLRKRKINSSKGALKDDGGYLTVQTIDRRLKNSSLISEMY
jgi:hypothetical protein